MSMSKSFSLPILLTPASSTSSNSLPSSPFDTRPRSQPVNNTSNRTRTLSWLGQSVESVVAISGTVVGADFAQYQGVDSRSRLTRLSSTSSPTSRRVPSGEPLQGSSEPALVSSSALMTSRMFSRPSGHSGRVGAKPRGAPRVDVAPRTPKSIGSIVELPDLHDGLEGCGRQEGSGDKGCDSPQSYSPSLSSSPSLPSSSSRPSSGEHSAVSSPCSSPASPAATGAMAKDTSPNSSPSSNSPSGSSSEDTPCTLPHSPPCRPRPCCPHPQHPRPPHSSSCTCSAASSFSFSPPSPSLPIVIPRSRSIALLSPHQSHSHSHALARSESPIARARTVSSRTLLPIRHSQPSLSSCHTYALNTSPVECQSLSGPLSAPPPLLRRRGSLFSALSISLNPFGATSPGTRTCTGSDPVAKSTPATPLYRSPDYLTAFFADTPPSPSPRSSSTLRVRTPRSRTSPSPSTGTAPHNNYRRTATWHVDLSSAHTDLGIDIPIDKATPFSSAPSSFSRTLPASSAVSHQRSRTASQQSPRLPRLPQPSLSFQVETTFHENEKEQETKQILSSALSLSPSSLSSSPPSYSPPSPPATPRHNPHPHTPHRILINSSARSPIDSRIHHRHHHPHATHNINNRRISSAPSSRQSNTHSNTSAGSRYRSRNTASSLYQPILIPKKANDTLDLVTTEPSKHGGPPKSTQSTMSAHWDNNPTLSSMPSTSVQSTEPSSGSADWMVVSGATYHSNPIPTPINVTTPIAVREEQLNRLPALQLLERSQDTDPVLDVDVAHQIRLELPRKLRNATKWNLVYSSDQHGISMTTLYHRCRGKGPMILAVKDSYDCVFGAFTNEEFKPNLTYYGTGECFLWNVTTLSSPRVPASPTFGPSPLPSPSPLQLSSTITTPATGRSPSPSRSPLTGNNASRAAQIGENRRQDLLQAMNDQLSVGARSPSPSPLSPFATHSQHAANSPSYSPSLRPVAFSSLSTPTGAPSTTPPSSAGTSAPVVPAPRRKKKQKVVQFWKWSGKNDYMILSEPGFIGMGGGDGKFGLWIHSDLERGHSARCATFENEPLAAACRHPIRGTSVNGHIELAPAKTDPVKVVGPDFGGPELSVSPSEDEEFYCQTVEIWSLVL